MDPEPAVARPRQPTAADAVIVGGLALGGLWELATIALMPSLVGTRPVLLEALQGSVPSMVAGGAFARVGRVPLGLAVLAPVPGLMALDPLLWWAGRRYRDLALRWYFSRRPADRRAVARSERLFAQWGGWTLVAAYQLPVPNAALYLLAGATGMSLVRFLALDGAGTLLHVGIGVGLGYALGQAGVDVAEAISRSALVATVLVVAAIVAVAVWRSRRD
jgi:membrane protein DedA with SNARE-associated domain